MAGPGIKLFRHCHLHGLRAGKPPQTICAAAVLLSLYMSACIHDFDHKVQWKGHGAAGEACLGHGWGMGVLCAWVWCVEGSVCDGQGPHLAPGREASDTRGGQR